MARFEDRHRELREAAGANADDHKGWDQWTTPADSALSAFRDATESLVDDLVAAVRLEHRTNHRDNCRLCAIGDALAALDEASGRVRSPIQDAIDAAKPTLYKCHHGERTATPTTVFAGAIHVCSCCGYAWGSLNPAPADGLCRFCGMRGVIIEDEASGG